MDMKKILQALDGASTKPVEGTSDMKRFVSIIKDSNSTQVLNEGANPHKVTLPVQMAMQHYQKPAVKAKPKPSLVDHYFKQVEEEQLQEKQERKQLLNQYASTIAQRVLMKESKQSVSENEIPDHSMGFTGGVGPGIQSAVAEEQNAPDVVSVDVPLLIRLLEYAREDAKTDMDLHNLTERLIAMSESGQTLTMDDYDSLVSTVQEGKKIKPKSKTNPCWTGYQQIGMKMKDGKKVPNCTAKPSAKLDELSNDTLGKYKKAASASASAADKAGDYETGNKRFKGIVKATNKQFTNDLKKHSGK